MVSKYKAIKVIKENQDHFIEVLDLKKYNITVLCINSKRAIVCKKEVLMGVMHFPHDTDDAVIYIYYDKHSTLEEVRSTLLHELLHVKFSDLDRAMEKNQKNLHGKHEESLVRFFEKLLIDKL